MATSTNKSWNAVLFVAVLVVGGFSSAARAPQEKQKPSVSQEEADRLKQIFMKRQNESRQDPSGQPLPSEAREPEAAAPQPPPPSAPAAIQQDSGRIRLNYENADLYDFVNQIASTLGITPIVIDPDIKGTVNILSTAPMSKEDIFPLFSLILKNNNAALIEENGIYQIVPISTALKRGIEIIQELPGPASKKAPQKKSDNSALIPPGSAPISRSLMETFKSLKAQEQRDTQAPASTPTQEQEAQESGTPRLATEVIRVDFVPVKDLIEPIKLFMTDGGVIMPYERLNMLILTDYTDNASKILQIVRMLDNEYLDPNLIDLIKIENNASVDVVDDLKKIFGSGSNGATGISFTSIDRINSIFVIASSKRGLAEVKHWIEQLDTASGRNIQTYVYVVQNSTASNIAMMLSALYGGEGSTASVQQNEANTQGAAGAAGAGVGVGRGAQSGAFGGAGSGYSSANQMGTSTPFGNTGFSGNQSFGGTGGYGAFGGGQQLGPRLNVSRSVTSQVLQGGEFTGLQGTVRMVVDDVNNSLIIQSTAADYAYISETIKKMDVQPRQVLIDARIFEVELTNSLSYGVNAILQGRGATGNEADHLTGGSINWADSVGLSANTFAFVGSSREILLRLNALRLKTKVRILEAPSVLALDGMQANISVGSEYPYPGYSYTSSVGGNTSSVGYRQTGVSLLVMPRISASGAVTLDITQEVSAPGSSVNIGTTGTAPSFNVSTVSTTLSVKDGETVAIAGLIREGDDFSHTGVPLLSDIPILGNLFGQTSRGNHRTELIILISPHVIRTPDGFEQMTQELKDSLRNVRKYADEQAKEHIEDMEDAREERYKQEQDALKQRKQSSPQKPE